MNFTTKRKGWNEMGEFIDLLKSIMTDTDEDEINELTEENIKWSEGKALVYSSNQHTVDDITKVLQESFKRGVMAALEFASNETSTDDVLDLDDDDDDDEDSIAEQEEAESDD